MESGAVADSRGLRISCAFATSMRTPDHIVIAEELGYRRAWCYDSPAVLADVWMILALAAHRTSTIGLGPGVVIPSLRHPMVTAAAISTLEALARGRVAVAVGSGFTGRVSLGQRPLRWDYVEAYLVAVRGLLRGDVVAWDGNEMQMLHPEVCGAARPIDVPILVGADGPKGRQVASRNGDGVFSASVDFLASDDLPWRALLMWGSVLGDGESASSPRTVAAVAPAVAVLYHVAYERGGAAAVDELPGGRRWRAAVEQSMSQRRHLAVHAGHQVELNRADQLVADQAKTLIPVITATATADELRRRLDTWAAAGISEVVYQPGGPDIERELERFARMAMA
ncbi:MAG: class flavin-dependent oxidoreductase [Pseudonocardiales bacterium]|nr:class flavin-dependent oxidoreductase [Pseudonocardiales bacterium]